MGIRVSVGSMEGTGMGGGGTSRRGLGLIGNLVMAS